MCVCLPKRYSLCAWIEGQQRLSLSLSLFLSEVFLLILFSFSFFFLFFFFLDVCGMLKKHRRRRRSRQWRQRRRPENKSLFFPFCCCWTGWHCSDAELLSWTLLNSAATTSDILKLSIIYNMCRRLLFPASTLPIIARHCLAAAVHFSLAHFRAFFLNAAI